jgi:hypothetical protein
MKKKKKKGSWLYKAEMAQCESARFGHIGTPHLAGIPLSAWLVALYTIRCVHFLLLALKQVSLE